MFFLRSERHQSKCFTDYLLYHLTSLAASCIQVLNYNFEILFVIAMVESGIFPGSGRSLHTAHGR